MPMKESNISLVADTQHQNSAARRVLCDVQRRRWVPLKSVVKSQLCDLECILGHAVNHSVFIGDAA